MPAESHRSISSHAADGGVIVGLVAQAVGVEPGDRSVLDLWPFERFKTRTGGLLYSRRDVFPPRLVGSDAQCLGRLRRATVPDGALPALPRKLMVVADTDKGEMGASVLYIWVVDVCPIDHTVAIERRGNVEVVHLACVGDAAEVVHRAVIAVRHLVWILHHLVDEVAEVQDEGQPLVSGRALVLPDHTAIGVLSSLIHALTRNEREGYRARIVEAWSCDRAAHPATAAVGIGEAIPIDGARFQPAHQHASSPVGGPGDRHQCRGDNACEITIFRNLGMKLRVRPSILIGPAGP